MLWFIVRVSTSLGLRARLCIILHVCSWDGVNGFVMHVQSVLSIASIYFKTRDIISFPSHGSSTYITEYVAICKMAMSD